MSSIEILREFQHFRVQGKFVGTEYWETVGVSTYSIQEARQVLAHKISIYGTGWDFRIIRVSQVHELIQYKDD